MTLNRTLTGLGTLLATLSLSAGGSALGNPHTPPCNRTMPSVAHHIDASAVILVAGTCVHVAAASKVADEWIAQGSDLQALDLIEDGAFVNDGPGDAVAVSLSGAEVYRIEPGEVMLVGADAAAGYSRGCLCKCGNGWVFVSTANCGGSTCNCNGQGPCIDPTNHQLVTSGFVGCQPGWGQGPTAN